MKKHPLPFPVDPDESERAPGLKLGDSLVVRAVSAADLEKPLMHCPPDGYGFIKPGEERCICQREDCGE